VTDTVNHLPGKRHPKASLWAVQRRLRALMGEIEEEPTMDEVVDAVVDNAVVTGGNIDKAALFLTELTYPNMFELRGSADRRGQLDPYCKVCGEIVERKSQEQHHGAHKRDRATYVTEQIRARKESSDMAKTAKITPKDQGVPAVYLNEDGTKFVPGRDASLKRDLIAAIDSLDNPKGLHTFTEQEAAKILAARDWNDWLVKSRKGREAKATREAAASQKKAARVKKSTQEKKAAARTQKDNCDVTPDPKPASKPRGARTRKVGS
jgi:hypothetical protein